ncbi:hypothetical protein CALCODRAFT_504456 [Calocera cornea HHB12733]|uniref:Uncharacterized protein n=1 Tax=Calocera cornea HHB12733 TaxID=1353952 RepID=A0A165CEH1_9BASI|nr:hypothetical protein CALCODRAFT_504456 [Calocera cornea HHB12733]
MRPSLAASLLSLLSLLSSLLPATLSPVTQLGIVLLALPAPALAFPFRHPDPAARAAQGLRELERVEERTAQAAEEAYARIERRAVLTERAVPVERVPHVPDREDLGARPPPAPPVAPGSADGPAPPVVGNPPVVLSKLDVAAARPGGVELGKDTPLALTLDRQEAEAALLQVESVRLGLESLEELLKSAASLTRLTAFKATEPEPPTLRTPPKPLSDDPALSSGHRPPLLSADDPMGLGLADGPELMYYEHAHLQDLYYGSYPPTELFYNKDAANDLREPIPLVPVNPEQFRDYSGHPRLTAEEFFGRNRRKGAR